MPYITNLLTIGDQVAAVERGVELALASCSFCDKSILVPAERMMEDLFCSEDHFRARYGGGGIAEI